MRTGFNIVFVKSVNAEVDRYMFNRALDEFKREYTPASFVEITEVEHMRTSYDPKRMGFTHSFSVSWQEPKEKLENNCE